MEHVKTVVSLDHRLYEQGEALASELKISRCRLFTLALEEFIRQRRFRRLLEQIYAAMRMRLTRRNGHCSGRCAALTAA
ncbi:MAG TPA: hypothetical protein VNK67_15280 [Burkholderiales bacterium]|nr:hypothetical protein [Burkholderiales bacterium]